MVTWEANAVPLDLRHTLKSLYHLYYQYLGPVLYYGSCNKWPAVAALCQLTVLTVMGYMLIAQLN